MQQQLSADKSDLQAKQIQPQAEDEISTTTSTDSTLPTQQPPSSIIQNIKDKLMPVKTVYDDDLPYIQQKDHSSQNGSKYQNNKLFQNNNYEQTANTQPAKSSYSKNKTLTQQPLWSALTNKHQTLSYHFHGP